jgi:RHS repeat-associated protein
MPINVATGSLDLECSDIGISGVVALTWERKYSSSWLSRPDSPLGRGWTCQYFSILKVESNGYELETPSGVVRFEADPANTVDGRVINYGSFAELFRSGDRLMVQRWDVDAGSVWRYCFPLGGPGQTLQLASIENASGQGLDLTWNGPQLVSVRQRTEGRTLSVIYHRNGLIHSLVYLGPSGAQHTLATYQYDQADRLVSAIDPAGYADRYEYDDAGRLRRRLVKDGAVFSFTYDRDGRCVRTTGLDRYDAKTVRYFSAAGYSEVTDSYGKGTTYRYNAEGQITEEINPLGARQTRSFDEHGRLVAKTDANGATTRFEYDAKGDRRKIIDALGQEFGFRYNRDHLLSEMLAPTGHAWTRWYDEHNHLIGSRDPTGSEWRIHYDENGLPHLIVDPNGSSREQRFVAGRMVQRSDWAGNWYSYQFDDFGRLTGEIDPAGNAFAYLYDVYGNLTRMVWPDGTSVSRDYDVVGNPVRFTDQEGHTVTYVYGSCSRLRQHRDRSGNTVRYVWGTEPGRLEKVINETGEEFDLEWDDAGRLARTRSFDGVELTYAYDPAGHLATAVNGAGEQQQFTRDALGRLVSRKLSTGGEHTFEYDPLSNVIAGTSGDHTITLVRDPLGRIVLEEQDDRWVASEYDRVGNPTRLASSFGDEVAYRFDGNRDVHAVSFLGEELYRFTRNSLREEIARQLPGGIRLTQTFDVRGLLRTQTLDQQIAAPGELVGREFQYDARGLLRRTVDGALGQTQYDYDLSARLVAVEHGGREERWLHDPAGNRIDVLERGGDGDRARERVYGPGNRLLRESDTAYEYDGNGRLVRKVEGYATGTPRVWQYRWDALNQLTDITTPEGAEWRYTYDAFGRRLGKIGPARTTTYLWNKFFLVKETGSNGSPERTWIFEPDSFRPLAQITDGALHSIITDELGTPLELVDARGRVVRLTETGGPSADPQRRRLCPLGHPGQLYDEETGFYYNHFRYFDPAAARFISQDPKNIRAGLNLYLYCPDPFRVADPLGLDSGALDKALGGTVGDGNQAHHIIPEQVMNQNADMIGKAESLGFQRDGKSNGILLPSDDAVATQANLPSHRGSHPQYNQQVGAEVAEIRNQWLAGTINDQEMLAKLQGVQDKWREKIENNDPDLPRGKTSSCKLG